MLGALEANEIDFKFTDGNCTKVDPDELFVQGAAQNRVKERICGGCALRAACLGYALANQMEYGVWGGTTERERRSMLRKNPDIEAWASTLVAAESVSAEDTLTEQTVVESAG